MRTVSLCNSAGQASNGRSCWCGTVWVPDPRRSALVVVLASDDNGLGFRISRLSRPLVIRPPAVFSANFCSPGLFTYMGPYGQISRFAVAAVGLLIMATAAGAADDVPRFNRDIRPILSEKCYSCHGPDSGTREAELRLDTETGAHEVAIMPGDADSSELFSRVSSDDPEARMPPPNSKKPPLTPEQLELIKKWINAAQSTSRTGRTLRRSAPKSPR